jgi:hypothetical protein
MRLLHILVVGRNWRFTHSSDIARQFAAILAAVRRTLTVNVI